MKVKLVDEAGTEVEVGPDKFDEYGIKVTPEGPLTKDSKVKVTVGDKEKEVPQVTITEEVPTQASTLVQNDNTIDVLPGADNDKVEITYRGTDGPAKVVVQKDPQTNKWSPVETNTTKLNVDENTGKVTLPRNIVTNDTIVDVISYSGNKKPVKVQHRVTSPSTPSRPSGSGSSSGTSTPTPKPRTSSRVAGPNRRATAVKLSKSKYNSAKTVIVVRDDNYADALTATTLSKLLNAPILLTNSHYLSKDVADEIARLGAKDVIIVGGISSVDKSVEKALGRFDSSIERIAGRDRYETSARVADRVVGITGKTNLAVLATGETFADALSVSPFAASKGMPILLVRPNSIPKSIQDRINSLDIKRFYIAGGQSSVGKEVESKINLIERFAGHNRYETSKVIAERTMKDSTRAFVASGEVFADALVVGPIAASQNAPVLLTT
ncbi:cell wall-binding repeat-containing protein, partial [Peptoniphilus asaccharolyticus]